MNSTPKTIAPEELAVRALSVMEGKKITALVVVDAEATVKGVLHLHDLWGTELM
jgi:arabinose-5-phosphate isomerase